MELWLISDTHFAHENIYKFVRADGVTRVRPEFENASEADEQMVELWNMNVRPRDHVYHLGDVGCRSATQLYEVMRRLNGVKRLVRGNHDKFQTSQYIKAGFKELHGMRLLFDVWLTHPPIHPSSMGRALGNAHGHIHDKPSLTGRYFNCSVEQIRYRPISFEVVRASLRERS